MKPSCLVAVANHLKARLIDVEQFSGCRMLGPGPGCLAYLWNSIDPPTMSKPSCLICVHWKSWPKCREHNGKVVRPSPFIGAFLAFQQGRITCHLWHNLDDPPWPRVSNNVKSELVK